LGLEEGKLMFEGRKTSLNDLIITPADYDRSTKMMMKLFILLMK